MNPTLSLTVLSIKALLVVSKEPKSFGRK